MTGTLADSGALSRRRKELHAAEDAGQRVISVCGGTGCRAQGAMAVFARLGAEMEARHLEGSVRTRVTGCHGFCARGPLVLLFPEGILYQGVRVEDVPEIVERTVLLGEPVERLFYVDPASRTPYQIEEDIPFYGHQQRVVLRDNGRLDPASIDDYIALGGYSALARALEMGASAVLDEVRRSGLRGRGGGGAPTGAKWSLAASTMRTPRYLVCNADEGDPGAFMDRSVLEGNPYSVLEGMTVGAYAISAARGFVYVRDEYPLAVETLGRALEEARSSGLLGEDILGSGLRFDVEVVRGGGAFVCGEQTALVASIEGRPGEPRDKYIRLAEQGLWGQPTVINNVETWTNVPHIVLRGAAWFRSIGTEGSPGTKIFSLVGKVNNTGLVEVPMGTTLREIVFDIGGGVPNGRAFKAVQTGGPSGGAIPDELLDLPVDFDSLAAAGSMMGSGGLIVADDRTCMVELARYYLDFLAGESCGKCLPCRSGISMLLEIVNRICGGEGSPEDFDMLESLGETMREASLCGLGKSAPNPVLSTLRHFRDEYVAHVTEHRCPAGVCKELTRFEIDEERCTGCAVCSKHCPVDAIGGEKRQPHHIDQERCTRCGECRDRCKFEAVVVKGREVTPCAS